MGKKLSRSLRQPSVNHLLEQIEGYKVQIEAKQRLIEKQEELIASQEQLIANQGELVANQGKIIEMLKWRYPEVQEWLSGMQESEDSAVAISGHDRSG